MRISKLWIPVLIFSASASASESSVDLPDGVESKALPSDASILKENPNLEKYVFSEPRSAVEIGFGLSPFGMIRDQMSISANLFQFHWVTTHLDWEVFSLSFAESLGGDDDSRSKQFTLRTVPKYRINQTFSIGPLLGYEFVSFPDLQSQLFNGTLTTPQEAFSSRGVVYGGVLSETFPLNEDLKFKVNQVVYKETYSTTNANEAGWTNQFSNPALNQNTGPINPGTVIMFEFSLLY
jgi:hypothetical protein